MENIPEAITAKEGKDLEIKDSKQFELTLEKDKFQIEIGKINNKKNIIIKASTISGVTDIFFENLFNLEDLVKLDKTFRAYDEIRRNILSFTCLF